MDFETILKSRRFIRDFQNLGVKKHYNPFWTIKKKKPAISNGFTFFFGLLETA